MSLLSLFTFCHFVVFDINLLDLSFSLEFHSENITYEKTSWCLFCFRSGHQKCAIKIGVLKNSTKFTESTRARVSFLMKLQS